MGAAQTDAANFRQQKINEILQYLQSEVDERERLYKKCKKSLDAFNIADGILLTIGVSSTAISIGLLATGIGILAALPIQGVGIITGVLGGIGKLAKKRLNQKIKKHDEIKILAQAMLTTVNIKVSSAYDDGRISSEEFENITGKLAQYMEMKEAIRVKARKAVKEINEVDKTALVQGALQDSQVKAEHSQ